MLSPSARRIRAVLQFPLTWAAVGAVGLFAVVAGADVFSDLPTSWLAVADIAIIAVQVIVYSCVRRYLAGVPVHEVSVRGQVRPLVLFAGVGLGVVVVQVVVFCILGYYAFTWNPDGIGVLVPTLVITLNAALFEELLFRGLLFQALERGLGSWIALAVSSVLFALAHTGNPGFDHIDFVNVLAGGFLLGAIFVATRNIWVSTAFHTFYNFALSESTEPSSDPSSPAVLTPTNAHLAEGAIPAWDHASEWTQSALVAVVLVVVVVLTHRSGRAVPLRRADRFERR